MDTDILTQWFDVFCKIVVERPLLQWFDGHLKHISIADLRRASDERIIILNFPTHFSDDLQPLDVSCFGPLKQRSVISGFKSTGMDY